MYLTFSGTAWILFKWYVMYAPLNFFQIGIKNNFEWSRTISPTCLLKSRHLNLEFWGNIFHCPMRKTHPVKGINDKPDLSDFPWILIMLHVAIKLTGTKVWLTRFGFTRGIRSKNSCLWSFHKKHLTCVDRKRLTLLLHPLFVTKKRMKTSGPKWALSLRIIHVVIVQYRFDLFPLDFFFVTVYPNCTLALSCSDIFHCNLFLNHAFWKFWVQKQKVFLLFPSWWAFKHIDWQQKLKLTLLQHMTTKWGQYLSATVWHETGVPVCTLLRLFEWNNLLLIKIMPFLTVCSLCNKWTKNILLPIKQLLCLWPCNLR